MGYKLAGFDVVAANDIDEQMARHYKRNHHPKHYFLAPIKELIGNLPDELIGIDLLDGSPPCSSFSMAGNREKDWGNKKHFREGQAVQVLDDLFFDFLDLVEYVKPKIVVAENVKGMIVGSAKGYAREVLRRFDQLGYNVQLFLINGADCGLPQRRERVFFVAARKEYKAPKIIIEPKEPLIGVSTAFDSVENSKEEIDDAMRLDPDGVVTQFWRDTQPGYSFTKASMKQRGKPSFFNWVKLHPFEPSPTVTAHWEIMFHWKEQRRLTLSEVRVLSSFPDDYSFDSIRIGGYMMGMSVPPYMMATVADAIRDQWLPHIGLR